MATIKIGDETTFTDVIGTAKIEGKTYLLVCGLIGRRSTMDYVLPAIHNGAHAAHEGKSLYSLGAKRYVGKKGSLGDAVQRTLVIPNQNSVQMDHKENENDPVKDLKVALWHGTTSNQESVLWQKIRKTPIPLLDAWKDPLLAILRDADAIDELREQNGLSSRGVNRITPIEFLMTDGLWGGAVLHLDDDDIAVATQFLLRQRRIAA